MSQPYDPNNFFPVPVGPSPELYPDPAPAPNLLPIPEVYQTPELYPQPAPGFDGDLFPNPGEGGLG